MEITYETDLFSQYKADFDLCHDLQSLRSLIDKYKGVSPDLAEVKMESPADFEDFMKGLNSDRQGWYPGDKWCKKYGSLVIPTNILQAQLIAKEFEVPWGVAYFQIYAALSETFNADAKETEQGTSEPTSQQ